MTVVNDPPKPADRYLSRDFVKIKSVFDMKSPVSEVALKSLNFKVLNFFVPLALLLCLFLSNPFSVFQLFCLKFIRFLDRVKF